LKGASGESKGSRRYDKENLLWQFTVAIRSDPVGFQAGKVLAMIMQWVQTMHLQISFRSRGRAARLAGIFLHVGVSAVMKSKETNLNGPTKCSRLTVLEL